ncbi:MAG: hypothetical protein ACEQSE_03660, partial [Candidatus Aquirickettsiella gammari]
ACVQCGQCTDACTQTQTENPQGNLLEWVNQAFAESEAALNGSTARVIQIKLEKNNSIPIHNTKNKIQS